MPIPIAAEITDHLKHHDYSLAVRRMLDACFDTGDHSLIRKAITWSKSYRAAEDTPSKIDDAWLQSSGSLLKEIEKGVSPVTTGSLLINASGISKKYTKGNFSLQPMSVVLQKGAILGVVGENGNGKTTLLRCLSGQLALDSGTIHYALLKKPDYFDIKNHVVFIPQRIPRWYGLLKDNLHFSAAIAGIHGSDNELMVDFMLERLNLGKYAQLTWNQISSGYRTRFEIARILLQKPQLLILDEPLANLDINAQQTMLTDLKYLAKSSRHPMGVILSSQQLHEVEKVADNVMLIKNGNCVLTTGPKNTSSVAVEVETTATRDMIFHLLNDETAELHYNGGFYTITSTQFNTQDLIGKLIKGGISISYFRDITYSTKRYF